MTKGGEPMRATDFAQLWLPVHLEAVGVDDLPPAEVEAVGNWVSALAERARHAYDEIGEFFGPAYVPAIRAVTDTNAAILVSSVPIRARHDLLRGRDQIAWDSLSAATCMWGLAAGDALRDNTMETYRARLLKTANRARATLEARTEQPRPAQPQSDAGRAEG